MDTRLTKDNASTRRLHPVRAWICFALAMTLLLGGIAIAVGFSGELYDYRSALLRIVPRALRLDFQGTDLYWDVLFDYMVYLHDAMHGDAPMVTYDEETGEFVHTIDGEAIRSTDDVMYDTVLSDTAQTTAVDITGEVHVYHYLGVNMASDVRDQNLYFTASYGEQTYAGGTAPSQDSAIGLAWMNGELYVIGADIGTPLSSSQTQIAGLPAIPVQEYAPLREYMRELRAYSHNASIVLDELDADETIVLIPNSRIIDSYSGQLYQKQLQFWGISAICWGIAALIVLIILLFIGVAIDHRSKAAADAAIGRLLGSIWIEVRLLVLIFAVCFYLLRISEGDEFIGYTTLIATVWFWFYCIAADLRQNGLRTFTCNSITWLLGLIRRHAAHLPLHKALARRWLFYLLPACLCALFCIISFAIAVNSYHFGIIVLGLLAAAQLGIGALVFLYLYFRTRNDDYADIAAVMDRICAIRDGRESKPLTFTVKHLVAPYADALEGIYAGIELAVAERTKSERTKIEMVTNISHDLKTPLTSIVGYADLLADVEGLPPEAMDYVSIISRKSARLSGLIKDLFVLTKATTSDLPLEIEPLDLTRLLNQLLAEQADAIAAAPVKVVASLPDFECPLSNDGTKLYRVFANLLENALRYSLDGSRIFLSLGEAKWEDGSHVWRVTVKNTSREYIDFTAEEILARFVRGDRNRTTEGSGLGLPIAKSFTELCGGRFDLILDGDSFCVIVDLPKSI